MKFNIKFLWILAAFQLTAQLLPGINLAYAEKSISDNTISIFLDPDENFYAPPGKSNNVKIVKILTIGNSYARNAINYLPEITSSVDGCEIIITAANIGGASLDKHTEFIELCREDSVFKPYVEKYCLDELLTMDNYDYVTIQQKSGLSFLPASYQPYLDILYSYIREHSPNSEILIHQTWAYAPDCPRLDEFGISREEMHRGLERNYRAISIQYELDILPSGNAFYQSFKKNPELDLWIKDRFHANINGSYLAGCVWFGKLFGISPKKITFIPEGMDSKTAKFLRNVAAKELRAIKSTL